MFTGRQAAPEYIPNSSHIRPLCRSDATCPLNRGLRLHRTELPIPHLHANLRCCDGKSQEEKNCGESRHLLFTLASWKKIGWERPLIADEGPRSSAGFA